MNPTHRYVQLREMTGQDQEALTRLDREIADLQRILAEGPAELQKKQDRREALATEIEVSVAMLRHAEGAYRIVTATPTMPDGALPIEAETQAHYLDAGTTQRLPAVSLPDGGQVGPVNPDGPAAGQQQRLNVQRGQQDGGGQA